MCSSDLSKSVVPPTIERLKVRNNAQLGKSLYRTTRRVSLRLNKPYHKVYPQKVCFYFPFPAPMHQGNCLSIYCLQNKSRNNDSGFGRMEYVSKGQAFWNQSSFNTAMKASWGISTLPTCFIRFFPAFCFSRSFFFRLTSPP